jgi:hypothetical protein
MWKVAKTQEIPLRSAIDGDDAAPDSKADVLAQSGDAMTAKSTPTPAATSEEAANLQILRDLQTQLTSLAATTTLSANRIAASEIKDPRARLANATHTLCVSVMESPCTAPAEAQTVFLGAGPGREACLLRPAPGRAGGKPTV